MPYWYAFKTLFTDTGGEWLKRPICQIHWAKKTDRLGVFYCAISHSASRKLHTHGKASCCPKTWAGVTVCNSINTIVSWDNGNYSSICYLLCNYFLMSTQAVLNIIEGIRTQYCDWTLHTMCDSLNFLGMMRVDGMGWHKLSPVSGPH